MIFLGGVHGAGKTHLLEEIKNVCDIAIYSASSLIAQKKDDDYIKDKFRANIESDQTLLLQAINEFVTEEEYILDGHFCLLGLNGEINRVPIEVFWGLPIQKIFVITADVNAIVERLYKRDGRAYKYDHIQKFQDAEIAYAKEIATMKNIDYEIVDNGDALLKYLQGKI